MALKRKNSKAKINWGWDAPEDRNGKATRTTKKQQRETKKALKSLSLKIVLISLGLLLLFLAVSGTSCYLLTKDDCFTLMGNKDVVIDIEKDSVYIEDGYKVIEFGKDVSDKVTIETNMRITEEGFYAPQIDELGNPIIGQYYIIYHAETFKYSKFATIERVRFVYFEESTDVVEPVD